MQLLANALIAGSLAALIAGGLSLVYGTLGVFNLALGQLALFGGYITWWLYQVIHLPFFVCVFGGLLGGALITWLTFELIIRPFYKHHRFLPLVTTIAMSMILDGMILLLFEERPRNILPGFKHSLVIMNARITLQECILILLTICLLSAFAYILHSTAFGRRLRAVTQHDQAAISLGIHSSLLHRVIFIMSGLLAACGGIFIGIDQALTPTLAFSITIKAYAAIIAGGKGNFWSAIFCAYMLALLEQLIIGIHWFGSFYVPAGYQATVALAVIILFLLLRPQGLFGHSIRAA